MNYSAPTPPASAKPDPVVLPHAGVIALSQDIKVRGRVFGFDESDENTRPFNLLRTQISRNVDETGRRIIGITSATPAAGKTYVSLNLAAAMSGTANRPVVLCDFDLRRGSVLDALDVDVPRDVSTYLRGERADWRDALYRIDETELYVLPCKPTRRGSSGMLSSPAFAELIAGLRQLPDDVLILVDLPPVFASDDALLTSQHLDSYILVVEYGRNTAEQVQEAMRLLEPTPCLGTILNRYKGGYFDAYGYGYGDPYGIKNYGLED